MHATSLWLQRQLSEPNFTTSYSTCQPASHARAWTLNFNKLMWTVKSCEMWSHVNCEVIMGQSSSLCEPRPCPYLSSTHITFDWTGGHIDAHTLCDRKTEPCLSLLHINIYQYIYRTLCRRRASVSMQMLITLHIFCVAIVQFYTQLVTWSLTVLVSLQLMTWLVTVLVSSVQIFKCLRPSILLYLSLPLLYIIYVLGHIISSTMCREQ